MPCAVSAHAGNERLSYLEILMPCAVLARAGDDFEPLEHLMPCAVLARASEDFEPLERFTASCPLIFDMASCHLKWLCAICSDFMSFDSTWIS